MSFPEAVKQIAIAREELGVQLEEGNGPVTALFAQKMKADAV